MIMTAFTNMMMTVTIEVVLMVGNMAVTMHMIIGKKREKKLHH